MNHIYAQISSKWGVDIKSIKSLVNVDGKGYPLRKSIECAEGMNQKTVFGDMHMVLNLLIAYLSLFYDEAIKKLAASLKITKSIKNIVATELKKVRQIVATVTISCLKRLQKYFPESTTADELLFKSFEILKEERLAYQQSFRNIGDVCNFEAELKDLKKLKTREKIRNSLDGLKNVAKDISVPEISALYIKARLEKKGLVPAFPTSDEFLDKQSEENLKIMCIFKNCLKKNRGASAVDMKGWIKETSSEYEMDPRKREILTLFALAWCGSLCYGYHVAMRTKNWNLKMFILKNSFGMFKETQKTTYDKMVQEFLTDLKNNFSEKEKILLKKMWVVPATSTNSYVGLDELTEFVNGFLKSHVKSVTKKNILFFSGYHAFIKDIDHSFLDFLSCGEKELDEDYGRTTEALLEDLNNLEEVKISDILVDENTIFNIFANVVKKSYVIRGSSKFAGC